MKEVNEQNCAFTCSQARLLFLLFSLSGKQ